MTDVASFYNITQDISIHTTRVGGDAVIIKRNADGSFDFNPHHPCGWWPYPFSNRKTLSVFQSTPPVWVVTYVRVWWVEEYKISIHTTRVGGDLPSPHLMVTYLNFNPHHPCGWWLRTNFCQTPNTIDFNPHHPCGWWRHFLLKIALHHHNFNPHHPCGWWHYVWCVDNYTESNFNPHHPCGWWLVQILN